MPCAGRDQYFHFRVGDRYGKGWVTGPRFKFRHGQQRALAVGVQVYVGGEGGRVLGR